MVESVTPVKFAPPVPLHERAEKANPFIRRIPLVFRAIQHGRLAEVVQAHTTVVVVVVVTEDLAGVVATSLRVVAIRDSLVYQDVHFRRTRTTMSCSVVEAAVDTKTTMLLPMVPLEAD
jgi:hypothetical protein